MKTKLLMVFLLSSAFDSTADSVLNEEKLFVLQNETMPSDRLTTYNLESNDTSSASNHFSIIADFSINII